MSTCLGIPPALSRRCSLPIFRVCRRESDAHGTASLPNVQLVCFLPSRRDEVTAPVGFGPLSATWPGRREDSAWCWRDCTPSTLGW